MSFSVADSGAHYHYGDYGVLPVTHATAGKNSERLYVTE